MDSLRKYLGLERVETAVDFQIQEVAEFPHNQRLHITYQAADGDTIPAFLWIPQGEGPFPAVLVHHQHNSQRHLGKSEVAGLAGDSWQAFGPELARRGFVVLAPDSICFEERRRYGSGIEVHQRDDIQHFIEMGRRLSLGDTLMRKVLSDASGGLSLLANHPQVHPHRIGALGHSYGGNTVLFQAALEMRIAYAVASGALCSYAYKREHDIPLEMALIIPGFAQRWDLHHLLESMAPRPVLIVSGEEDPYAKDAPEVIGRAQPNDHVQHFREEGGHALTEKRFERIISFIVSASGREI